MEMRNSRLGTTPRLLQGGLLARGVGRDHLLVPVAMGIGVLVPMEVPHRPQRLLDFLEILIRIDLPVEDRPLVKSVDAGLASFVLPSRARMEQVRVRELPRELPAR